LSLAKPLLQKIIRGNPEMEMITMLKNLPGKTTHYPTQISPRSQNEEMTIGN